MAFSAPGTAVTGAVLTSAFWNSNVRDNMLETAVAKVTTAGDLVQGTGANALARLAAVATGKALISGGVGAASSWGKVDPIVHGAPAYYCQASLTVTQSIPDVTTTAVVFGQKDQGATWWVVGSPTKITPSTAGIALVLAMVTFASSAAGSTRRLDITQGGTGNYLWHHYVTPAATGQDVALTVMGLQPTNGSTNYFELAVFQNSGGALNLTSAVMVVVLLGVA